VDVKEGRQKQSSWDLGNALRPYLRGQSRRFVDDEEIGVFENHAFPPFKFAEPAPVPVPPRVDVYPDALILLDN
tara:strand:+ start:725 stop:946 length:222 start_codon:yes stop_codon:yes gene_type:complete